MTQPSIDHIIRAAITVARTDTTCFFGTDRGRASFARRLAAAVIQEEKGWATPCIAKAIGLRSHSSVVVTLQRWRNLPEWERDAAMKEMRREIDRLRGGEQ